MRKLAVGVAVGLLVVGAVVWLGGIAGWWQADIPDAEPSDVSIRLEPVAAGFEKPVSAFEQNGTIYVVEQRGRILDLDLNPWLDISERVRSGGERGLLAATPDPAGARLFVHYSDAAGDTMVSWFPIVDGRPDPTDERVVLQVGQPYPNHNGGQILFGPDGYLYVGLGDGGLAADPDGNGQDPSTLLGSILRLDVAGDAGYEVPADNPFVDGGGAPEVWAYGLRNPWRFHFDPATDDLWVGDVGQGNVEEMTRIPAGEGGHNLGWDHWEGSRPFGTRTSRTEHLGPAAEYDHDGGHCSITGGIVVRGGAWSGAEGLVLLADFCSGTFWGVVDDTLVHLLDTDIMPSGFAQVGEDVYVLDHGGSLYQLGPVRAQPDG